jgi:hypothetical protein
MIIRLFFTLQGYGVVNDCLVAAEREIVCCQITYTTCLKYILGDTTNEWLYEFQLNSNKWSGAYIKFSILVTQNSHFCIHITHNLKVSHSTAVGIFGKSTEQQPIALDLNLLICCAWKNLSS